MTTTESTTGTLTAVTLVAMLRERGYFVARSREFCWAIVPRVAADDPILLLARDLVGGSGVTLEQCTRLLDRRPPDTEDLSKPCRGLALTRSTGASF